MNYAMFFVGQSLVLQVSPYDQFPELSLAQPHIILN
jgi:hypothetical protein